MVTEALRILFFAETDHVVLEIKRKLPKKFILTFVPAHQDQGPCAAKYSYNTAHEGDNQPVAQVGRLRFSLSWLNRHAFLFIDFPALSRRNFRPFAGQSILPPQKLLDKRPCPRRLFSSRSPAPKRVSLVNRTTRDLYQNRMFTA